MTALALAAASGAGCGKPPAGDAPSKPVEKPVPSAPASSPRAAPSASPKPEPTAAGQALDSKALQAEIAATEATLTERYKALDQRRKALPPGDAAALEQFNQAAAAYTQQRAAFVARQQELERLRLAETRARIAAAEAERPAMELLGRLRAAIVANDFAAQAQWMSEALGQHRGKAAFAEISVLARSQLERVTLETIQRVMATRGSSASPSAGGPSLAALRRLINGSLQPVAPGEGRIFEIDFHPNPSLPPLDYPNVTKAQLIAKQQLYTSVAFVRAKRHPELLYRGADVEFNLLLKPYYQDQTLPTKRLSEADYEQMITLCRQIAKEGAPPSAPTPASAPTLDPAQTWAQFQRLRREWPR